MVFNVYLIETERKREREREREREGQLELWVQMHGHEFRFVQCMPLKSIASLF